MNKIANFFECRISEGVVEVSFECPDWLSLGVEKRRLDVLRIVRRALRRAEPTSFDATGKNIKSVYSQERIADIHALLEGLQGRLDRYAKQSLYPNEVEDILGISSHERLRWTKEGRLTHSGSGTFRVGKNPIGIFRYSVSVVAELIENPDKISQWRAEDAEAEEERP